MVPQSPWHAPADRAVSSADQRDADVALMADTLGADLGALTALIPRLA
jgi:hypothetical protein